MWGFNEIWCRVHGMTIAGILPTALCAGGVFELFGEAR